MNLPSRMTDGAHQNRDPLCVDLDGTLVRTDCLWECCAALIRRDPILLAKLPLLLVRGRAQLKHELAERAQLDVSLLPYNQELLAYLKEEKGRGRQLILATAASGKIARGVAEHLKLFDGVLASDERVNLKGNQKAAALTARFGQRGFSYAGNSAPDLKIWGLASSAITVDAPRSVVDQIPAEVPVEKQLQPHVSTVRALVKALRPHQWAKNVLVFIPIITSGAIEDAEAWTRALVIMAAYCCVASSVYVVNDLSDLSADRAHVRKRKRPFASGDLSIGTGVVLSIALMVVGFSIGSFVGGLWFLLGYVALSTAYSFKLKTYPLVDVFVLSALYSLRLFTGGAVTGHPVSLWLLAYSSFLFLSLAFLKRATEIADNKKSATRGYRQADLPFLQSFGIGSTFVSSTVLALYVQSEMVIQRYGSPEMLWGVVPLMLLWQCRLWLVTGRGRMHDDPIVFAAKDWVSGLIVLALGVVIAASYADF